LIILNSSKNTNTTYAMANISAVSTEKIPPNYSWPVLLVILGVLFVWMGFMSPISLPLIVNPSVWIGLLLEGGGIAWAIKKAPRYDLAIFSAGVRTPAVISKDKQYIDKLVQAVHEAIIQRG